MEQKHSGLGIASFILSMALGALIFLLFIVATMMEASTPGGIDENSPGAILLGLFLVACLGIDVVAIGLGIAGLMQKDRKKAFSIMGIVFASTTIVGTIFLLILGNTM